MNLSITGRQTSLTRRSLLAAPFAARAALSMQYSSAARPNVLFIVVDDLRCELGCYGRSWVKSPNIDRLSRSGVTFENAYCQIALCSPSRTSVLTGLRPDQTRIFDLRTHFRKYLPNATTLPQYLKKNGYVTTGFSKIYHLGNHTPGGLDDPDSWSEPSWHPGGPPWGTRACRRQAALQRQELLSNQWTCDIALAGFRPGQGGAAWEAPSVEPLDIPDSRFTDAQTTDAALAALPQLRGRPFFLGVGYLNPHLPFNAPKRFFDLYPPGSERMPSRRKPPQGVPEAALHNWGELRQYNDIAWNGELPDQKARELIRGYYAATSFVDAQIGRLLDGLEQAGLAENTVVALWGDNGFHLGDHGLWCKHTNFEEATRVPLILRLPKNRHAGKRVATPVELVDLYPTLAELAGLQVPSGLAGTSLRPLIEDPRRQRTAPAWSQFPRRIPVKGDVMGYSLRTSRYRYTEWRTPDRTVVGRELYDYEDDPEESANLAEQPARAAIVRELSRLMEEGLSRA